MGVVRMRAQRFPDASRDLPEGPRTVLTFRAVNIGPSFFLLEPRSRVFCFRVKGIVVYCMIIQYT